MRTNETFLNNNKKDHIYSTADIPVENISE